MKNIETEIIINAPVNQVWEILKNFSEYPKWNPFILKMAENKKMDNSLSVMIKSGENKKMEFQPIVLKDEFEKEFRWLGHLFVKGLFDGEHYFILEKQGPDKTKFIHGEKFSGMLSSILLSMIRENTTKGFQSMNQALKERAEKNN